MKRIFETTVIHPAYGYEHRDWDIEAEARTYVEAVGEGRVVTFVHGFDGQDRSSKMDVFENGAWRPLQHPLKGGRNGAAAPSRRHAASDESKGD